MSPPPIVKQKRKHAKRSVKVVEKISSRKPYTHSAEWLAKRSVQKTMDQLHAAAKLKKSSGISLEARKKISQKVREAWARKKAAKPQTEESYAIQREEGLARLDAENEAMRKWNDAIEKPRKETCEQCNGDGSDANGMLCETCNGDGVI